ncbi:hypothetical protein QWY22_02065 [Planococcus liqunii]|uniref:hypothetical protein n=1 Tax=Planococcus liqunii TaxID=3058394 RepID=UPI00260F782B|nr:hypothetical protein [Planococcus sp. N056]WKA51418.1 hypothetical protein QWY22_02065 [Planococcus sp. N056]
MDLKVSLKDVPKYLNWKDSALDLRYNVDTDTRDVALTRVFDPQLEEDLERYQILDLQGAKQKYSLEIEKAEQQVYFYRIANLMFLFLLILAPAVALYFFQSDWIALVFALLFIFLMIFLVECFNQAYLNKFQKKLKDEIGLEQAVHNKTIPFENDEVKVHGSSATVLTNLYPEITDPNYKKGKENIIRFGLKDNSIHPLITVKTLK